MPHVRVHTPTTRAAGPPPRRVRGSGAPCDTAPVGPQTRRISRPLTHFRSPGGGRPAGRRHRGPGRVVACGPCVGPQPGCCPDPSLTLFAHTWPGPEGQAWSTRSGAVGTGGDRAARRGSQMLTRSSSGGEGPPLLPGATPEPEITCEPEGLSEGADGLAMGVGGGPASVSVDALGWPCGVPFGRGPAQPRGAAGEGSWAGPGRPPRDPPQRVSCVHAMAPPAPHRAPRGHRPCGPQSCTRVRGGAGPPGPGSGQAAAAGRHRRHPHDRAPQPHGSRSPTCGL